MQNIFRNNDTFCFTETLASGQNRFRVEHCFPF